MAITISLKRRDDEHEHLLFPEAAHLPEPTATAGGDDGFWGTSGEEGQLAVDVYETDKEIVLRSAIAGVELSDLEVFLHNDMLTVRGNRKIEHEADVRHLVSECHWGSFSRSVILPTEIDADAIAATLKDGVLTIRMPKLERSKRIRVKEA